MSTVTGVVHDVEVFTGISKKTQKSFTKYTLIMQDGTKYPCGFDQPKCKHGDTVTFFTLPPDAYSNGNEYGDPKSVVVTEGAPAGTMSPPKAIATQGSRGFNTEFPVPQDHDRIATLRVAALASAVAAHAFGTGGVLQAEDTQAIIATAYEFTQFISGAMDTAILEAAEEEKGVSPVE